MATGQPNAAFARIAQTMPQKEGPAVKAEAGIDAMNARLVQKDFRRFVLRS